MAPVNFATPAGVKKQNTFVTPISKHAAPATPFSTQMKSGTSSTANLKALKAAVEEKTKQLKEQQKLRAATPGAAAAAAATAPKTAEKQSVKERLGEFRKKNEAREQAARMAKERELAAKREAAAAAAASEAAQGAADDDLAARQGRESYDNYEMSDHEGDSDDEGGASDYEEQRERRAGKPIPEWAQGSALTRALERQYGGRRRIDPDAIFPDGFETCDLAQVFRACPGSAARRAGKSYSARGSTGNWQADRLTFVEKLTYRRDMGFQKQQQAPPASAAAAGAGAGAAKGGPKGAAGRGGR